MNVSLLRCLAALVVVAVFVATGGTADAAPEWAVTLTHQNAYGAQQASCLTSKEEDFPSEPEKDCGVDPFTGSGTTFVDESGFNEYSIVVRNVGNEPAGLASVGQTLNCGSGTWKDGATAFTYQWLRDGTPIVGADDAAYTVQAADAGVALQCRVSASNAGGTSLAMASGQTGNPATPVLVAPAPTTPLPTPPTSGIAAPTGTVEAGKELTCSAGTWKGVGGSEPYVYTWYRNGIVLTESPITALTSDKYTLTAENTATPATFQCAVVASNGTGGSVASVSANKNSTAPAPMTTPPVVGTSTNRPLTSPMFDVVDHLPPGLTLSETNTSKEASGTGWTCQIAMGASTVTCNRTAAEQLAPGAEWPPIILRVRVGRAPEATESNTVVVTGGDSAASETSDPTTIASAVPFGVRHFLTSVTNELGSPLTQAAGHPFAASTELNLNYTPNDEGALDTAGGGPKEVNVELPPGFIGDPLATPRCSLVTFAADACSPSTAVGYVHLSVDEGTIASGAAQLYGPLNETNSSLVYDLTPPPGQAAEFGFYYAVGLPLTLVGSVRSDGDFGLSLRSSAIGNAHWLTAAQFTFCDSGASEVSTPSLSYTCNPSGHASVPFLTLPSMCSGSPPQTTVLVSPWDEPTDQASASVYNGDKLADGTPSASESLITGCDVLQFAPEVEYGPSATGGTPQADQPTGATFRLKVPQINEAEKLATPELKSATVTLPEGMAANPSAAEGLEACSNAQFGLGSTVEPAEPAACPQASQVGTVQVVTPLLESALEGQVFIGEPECSPCSSADAEQGHLFRLFLQVRLPERGVIVKLAGKVSANSTTGRLQATFTEQPQLPFSELVLTLKGGPRAPLANPQICGLATTTTVLTPWSAPGLGGLSGAEAIEGTPDATPSSMFSVDWDGKGGACPATLPFSPSFLAQTESSAAGQYSPLDVSFGRPQPSTEAEERNEQNLAGISLSMPEGLLGKIADVEQCAEAQANAGACPAASEIGTATVAVGAGSHPYYLIGHVYLTGPYKGDPFGLSIAVPAEAGPFKLAGNTGMGLEVVRAAIAVNPHTAALSVTSDSFPQIVDGVPLRLHDVHVDVNRLDFTLNPTSCAAGQQIVGSITGEPIDYGEAAKTASVSTPFAAIGCAALPFRPTLTASTSGATSLKDGASLNVTIAASTGEANIGKVDLTLPKALPARLSTLHQACTEAQFASNAATCPEGSAIGIATARTPLLSGPLSGPVYIVSHGGAEFPDVEMVLQGENGLEIVLDGQTQITGDTTYSRFESVPDAPISSFETSLPAGPHSIFGSSEDLCTAKSLALGATLTGQNGAQTVQSVPIAVTGCPAATTATPKPTVKIEKTRVKGSTVRVTVKITAKGRLSVSGAGLKTTKPSASKAGTFVLTTSLTKTERAKLRKRRLRLKLRVGYVPTTGASSSVSTTVTFR